MSNMALIGLGEAIIVTGAGICVGSLAVAGSCGILWLGKKIKELTSNNPDQRALKIAGYCLMALGATIGSGGALVSGFGATVFLGIAGSSIGPIGTFAGVTTGIALTALAFYQLYLAGKPSQI